MKQNLWNTRADLARFAGHLKPGKTNVLCPAGIGDFYWIYSKFHTVSKECFFWFPKDEDASRGVDVATLLGVECGLMPGLTTEFVWGQHGSPAYKEGETLVVQANRHLEAGLHLNDWYPGFQLEYPKVPAESEWAKPGDYIAMFTCTENYMGGQLHPTVWATIIRCIIQTTGLDVVLIGAGKDVDLCQRIESTYGSDRIHPVYNKSLREVLNWVFNARLFVGVASGFTILSTCHRTNTLTLYPRHLSKMPGTFEPAGARGDWCYVDEFPGFVYNGMLKGVLNG